MVKRYRWPFLRALGQTVCPRLRGGMLKNETELITKRVQITNNYIGAPPGAKRESYRPCILSGIPSSRMRRVTWPITQAKS